MRIIGWILFGLLVGIVAKFLTPGRDLGGFLITALLGIAGTVVGGVLGLTIAGGEDGSYVEIIAAVVGAIIPVAAYGYTMSRTVSA